MKILLFTLIFYIEEILIFELKFQKNQKICKKISC